MFVFIYKYTFKNFTYKFAYNLISLLKKYDFLTKKGMYYFGKTKNYLYVKKLQIVFILYQTERT